MEKPSSFQQVRNTKSTRIWFMIVLIAVIIGLYMAGIIKKWFAIGLWILLLAAIGIETFNYDLDLGKLWETGNIQESRVSHTKDGIKLMGSCAIPKNGEGDLNCSNFNSQPEAQAKYEQCATEITSYNVWVDTAKVKSLDIYRLDGDKDGIVCESLPGAPIQEEVKVETPVKKTTVSTQKKSTKTSAPTTSTNVKKENKVETSGTFQTTPLLRTGKPYEMTEASDRSTPKALPQ